MTNIIIDTYLEELIAGLCIAFIILAALVFLVMESRYKARIKARHEYVDEVRSYAYLIMLLRQNGTPRSELSPPSSEITKTIVNKSYNIPIYESPKNVETVIKFADDIRDGMKKVLGLTK